jgi:hypothetical protein
MCFKKPASKHAASGLYPRYRRISRLYNKECQGIKQG